MKYGPHSQLVEEIHAFLEGDDLLKPSRPIGRDVMVIHDIEEAYRLSEEAYFGADQFTWGDIKAGFKANVYALADRTPGQQELEKQLNSVDLGAILNRKIWQRKLKQQDITLYEAFFDAISSDLYYCALSRAFQGTASEFWETIFDIYKGGGVPCGWEGNYPEGRIVAYVPVQEGKG